MQPTVRSADRSKRSDGFIPAFMLSPMKAGLVPKNVMRSRSAKRQSVSRSGCPGLPSNCITVHSSSSVDTSRFHMIQLVDENQKKRSSRPMSRCSAAPLKVSTIVPPWPCTMGFGMPVVPDE